MSEEARFQRDVNVLAEMIYIAPVGDDADNDYDTARRILRSDWLAQHDAEVKVAALREAASRWDSAPNDAVSCGYVARTLRKAADRVKKEAGL